MKINTDKIVKLWGVIDLAYIAWFIISALLISKIPFYSSFVEGVEGAKLYGETYSIFFVVVTHIMQITIIASGFLMVMSKRIGVYLSLSQAPFRLLLILPLTFFFIASVKKFIPSVGIAMVVVIYLLEIVKIVTQVKWLRESKKLAI